MKKNKTSNFKLYVLFVIFLSFLVSGMILFSSSEHTINAAPSDTIAPSSINNLSVPSCTYDSCTLSWTSPGDDNNTGTASSYDIRYSTSLINDSNWDSAIQATEEPIPQISGSTQTFTITGLTASTVYYFTIKTSDEIPNTSSIGNSSSETTLTSTDNKIYYISPTGSDNVGNGTIINPWATLKKAFTSMSGGDTLIVKDGTYTGTSNQITPTQYPPYGSVKNYTIIKAENDGGVTFDGEDVRDMFNNTPLDLTTRDVYWQFEGLIWGNTKGTGVAITYSRYIKVLRCGNYDAGDGNNTNFSVSRNSSYILFENCYSYGSGRYKFIAYQSSHIVFRNCVARIDRCNPQGEVLAGFSIYSNDDVEVQNCIVIDSDQTDHWQNVADLAGAFAVPSTDMDANRINFVNCIGLNNKMGGITTTRTEYNSAYDVTFNNCVIWDYTSWRQSDAVNNARGLRDTFNHCTFGLTASTDSGYAFQGYDKDGSSETIIKNSIVYAHTGAPALYDIEYFDYNCVYGNTSNYISTTPGAHVQKNTNPIYNALTNPTGALKYITRIEAGSSLSGDANDAGDIGANIITLIGTPGTLWGEPGYNTDTGVSMWPFPNEDLIKKKMKAYNVGGINGNRGFAADGNGLYGGPITLTSYIWEYLGNACPSDICDYSSTPPPVTPSITLAKQADQSQVQEGDDLTYTIRYENTSSVEAKNIVITDNIPEGSTYIEGSATNGGTYDSLSKKITWIILSLEANTSNDISFKVQVGEKAIPPPIETGIEKLEIKAMLHPSLSVLPNTPTTVSFGMPFPKDFLADLDYIRIKDNKGKEIPAHISEIVPWRNLMMGDDLSSTRSALIQVNINFSDTSTPVDIVIETGVLRTKDVSIEVPVKDNWVLVDDDKYPASYGVYEPSVYVSLPPDWLGKCAIKTKTVPFGTYNEFDWYDNSLSNNNPNINDGQNFFKTMINDDSRVTEENDIDYLNVGEYEPWLFDRAMTMYAIYIRSGNVEVLKEAHRASYFYSKHIKDNGFFDLKTNNDLKYSYGEGLLADLMLIGDESHIDKIENIAKAANTFNYIFNPEADHGLWTERHLAFAWLAYITAFEATGNSVYSVKSKDIADYIFTLQNNPPSNAVHGQAPDDGALMHSMELHEGWYSGSGTYWIFSPWMTTLLIDAMDRYFQHSGDIRVIASAKRFGDAIINVANTNFTMGGGVRRIPWYLASSDGNLTDNGEWADMEHCLDVAKITAFAYYYSVLEGSPVQKYLDETLLLLDAAEWVIGTWIRPGGPAIGKSIYRLAPPRKGNWWFRTTSDLDYLIH